MNGPTSAVYMTYSIRMRINKVGRDFCTTTGPGRTVKVVNDRPNAEPNDDGTFGIWWYLALAG